MNCKEIKAAIETASRRNPYGAEVESHLGGCPDCRHHADENNSLLKLLSAQPRVGAPADFDFRLRARLARAKSEQTSPASALEKFWTRTFSWGHAVTAMAAAALVVAFSTFYFNQDKGVYVKTENVAFVNGTSSAPSNTAEPVNNAKSQSPTARAIQFKLTGRNVKVSPNLAKSEAPAPAISQDVASVDNAPRFYHRETRQLVPDRNFYGAEAAAVNSAKPAAVALTF
jgi:hypothetical protein